MKYQVKDQQVKVIGRTYFQDEIRWCGHSGSGVGFQFTGKTLEIELWGDNATEGFLTEGKARIGIFINGQLWKDMTITKKQETVLLMQSEEPETISVEILKLSECAMTTMGIGQITTDEEGVITPLPDKKIRIEIIGDSITCGYGVDTRSASDTFSTETEDVTKAYSYRLAKSLGADYSMVCFSGYGIVSGYTATGEQNTKETLPQYYGKTGFSYASPTPTLKLQNTAWDFSKFVPHLVLMNLGTNDASYCQSDPVKIEEYKRLYIQFLKQVRDKNPKAEILCVVGVMGETLVPALKELVSEYSQESGDYHVHFAGLTEQLAEDGYAADAHPSQRTHEKMAKVLESVIRERGIL